MRFHKFDGIFLCACPKKLKGCDDAELAETRKILGIRKLDVGKRMRQTAVAVRFACCFYPVRDSFTARSPSACTCTMRPCLSAAIASSANRAGSKSSSPFFPELR